MTKKERWFHEYRTFTFTHTRITTKRPDKHKECTDKNKIQETYGYVYTHAVIRESLVNVSLKKNLILGIKKEIWIHCLYGLFPSYAL
jgi:hypothetical protein